MSDKSDRGLRHVRWTVFLPAVMVAATIALWYLDRKWLIGAGYWDDMPVTTARGLIRLINGPGALVLPWPLPVSLVLVAGFWAWIGSLLERKLRGLRETLIKVKWLRGALFGLGLISALFFLAVSISLLSSRYQMLPYRPNMLRSSPHRKLLGRELALIGSLLWSTGYVVYFSAKLLNFRFGQKSSSESLGE